MRHWRDIATRPTRAHRCIMALTWCLSLMAGGAALAAPSTAGASPQCLPSHAAVVPKMLSFSLPPNGNMPALWHGRPTGAIAFTKSERPNRARVVRIALGPGSPATFASLTNCMARDFAGKRITLRGELRTVGVKGFAGLTLIESASDGVLAVESMRAQDLHGTTGWREYSVTLPVKRRARRVLFGAMLSGKGEVRIADLQLLADGKPVWSVRKKPLPAARFVHGSGIRIDRLSGSQIQDLVTLGKVWGFLKYYDPAVTAGRHQWDYALLRVMPRVLAAADRQAANAMLARWIKTLGPVPRCHPCARVNVERLQLRPDLGWIDDAHRLGRSLSTELRDIRANRVAGPQFYVMPRPGVGNPIFWHERRYREIRFPDCGFQLLALFRFWNIVEYWYPYRNGIGESWDKVLTEFVPRLALARTRTAYELALTRLIAEVHDSHTNLWNALQVRPPVGACRIPVQLQFVRRRPVVTKRLTRAAPNPSRLERGDVLTRLGGIPVRRLIRKWSPYYGDSNEAARLRDIAAQMTRGTCGSVQVGIRRAGRPLSLTVERIKVPRTVLASSRWDVLPGPAFQLLSPQVAYLKLSSAKADEAADYISRAQGTEGLIIDLRDYPSQFMVFALGSHLVERPTPFVRFSYADFADPGAFVWGNTVSITPAAPHYSGKVVILVNQLTQSKAEYTAMAFRAALNAIVVGSTTAGADGNVSLVPLPGGLVSAISGLGIYYPDRQPTQRVGIIPNVVIHPTVRGIRAGRDQVLEAAIRLILGPKTPSSAIEKLYMPQLRANADSSTMSVRTAR